MRCAARLALAKGLLSESESQRHDALLDALGMPKRFPGTLELDAAWEAMGRDKKTESGKRVFILPQGLGKVAPVRGIEKAEVLEALRAVMPGGTP
jgi:3-dehydroquinate synthase/shikimate kinase/3-dehydroquinate synthase